MSLSVLSRRALALTITAALLALLGIGRAAASQLDGYTLPGSLTSEPMYGNASGSTSPWSYTCPPNLTATPPPMIAASSWASYLTDNFVGSNIYDEAAKLFRSALQDAYDNYTASHDGQSPPNWDGVDFATSYAQGKFKGALTDPMFWEGVIQRLGDYAMPQGVDARYFLGYAALYYGLSTSCRGSLPGADTWLYQTSAGDLFLKQGSSWAKVDVTGALSQFATFRAVRGAELPTWLVMSPPNSSGYSTVQGTLELDPGAAYNVCNLESSTTQTTNTSINQAANSALQAAATWAPGLKLAAKLPTLLPPCPTTTATFTAIAGPEVDSQSLTVSDDARHLAAWVPDGGDGNPALRYYTLRYATNGVPFYAGTSIASAYRLGTGFDGTAHVAMSADGTKIAACRVSPQGAGGFGNVTATAGNIHFPLVFDLATGRVTWPASGLTSPLDCSSVTMNDDGSRIWWGQRAGTGVPAGWYSVDTTPPAYPQDATAPAVTGTADREPDYGGWYTAPVTVTWSATDPAPSSGAPTTPTPVTLAADGVHTVTSAPACDPNNNCGTGDYIVRLDQVGPDVAWAADRDPNAAGWYRKPVTLHATCTDPVSGVASCPDPQTVSEDGPEMHVSGTAYDNAGNATTGTSAPLRLDSQPPTVTAATQRNPDHDGWYTSPVQVSFACTDELSGVGTCPKDQNVSDDGVHTVAGTAVDAAGNSAQSELTVRLDTTAPHIVAQVSPEPNAVGWDHQAAQVTFACSDPGPDASGVADCPDPVVVADDTGPSGMTVDGTTHDVAGNETTTHVTVRVDQTAPVPSVVSRNQTTVTGTATDISGSGVDEVTVTVSAPGGLLWPATTSTVTAALACQGSGSVCQWSVELPRVGPLGLGTALSTWTVTAQARDVAGNSSSVTKKLPPL